MAICVWSIEYSCPVFFRSKKRRQPADGCFALSRSDKPTKAKTPTRTQGFFQLQMAARGGIDHGRWVFDSAYSLFPAKVQLFM
jgi:hypothetical protein